MLALILRIRKHLRISKCLQIPKFAEMLYIYLWGRWRNGHVAALKITAGQRSLTVITESFHVNSTNGPEVTPSDFI